MKIFFDKLEEYILFFDDLGRITLCNSKLINKLGYKEEELYKLNVKDILCNQEEKLKQILNSDIDIDKDKDKDMTLKMYTKTNDIISIYANITPNTFEENKGFYLIGKNVLKEYTIEQLETLLDNINIGAWIKDLEGKYIYINKELSKMAGKSKDNIIGKKDTEVWAKKTSKAFRSADIEVIKSKKPKVIKETNIVDGKEVWVETYKAPILDEDKNVKFTVGITKNINLIKKIEDELYNNYKQINSLHNIISKNNDSEDDTPVEHVLVNICNELLSNLNINQLSIWIYDYDKKQLERKLNLGEKYDYEDIIKINNDIDEEFIFSTEKEGLKTVGERRSEHSFMPKIGDNVEYIGVYNLELKSEFIGLLTTGYEHNNKPRQNEDDLIKAICCQISMIIKNCELSKKVRIENERRENIEKDLELFLSIATDFIGIVDINGYLRKISLSWTKILGWSEDELLAMHIRDLVHPEDRDKSDKLFSIEEVSECRKNSKIRYLKKDGKIIWVERSAKYISEKNYFIVTGKDITEDKYIEEQKKTLEEAIQLESIKNEFFANISHEFKTPLNIILGTMQLLSKGIELDNLTTEKLVICINSIKQNSYRLLRLVNNLIDMSRIDTGFYELQLANHNIVSIIEDITLSVVDYVEGKNINLIFDTDIEEEVIACDPDKIERIMLNILSNAIKHTEEDGVIFIKLKSENSNVKVSIKDNGKGIPKEKLDIIFDRFRQVNSSLTKPCEGSGIGLSLVRSLIEMHDGRIWVDSEIGEGAEFIFEIPIRLVEHENDMAINNINISNNRIEKCSIEFSDIYK
ncbi:PAS domain S-box protein [Romboutsia sp.]|uniref:PAS domain S-box protein n=1 Tax=Romboutsia sp. TaxID=1965302 RepID=UPI003F2DD51B